MAPKLIMEMKTFLPSYWWRVLTIQATFTLYRVGFTPARKRWVRAASENVLCRYCILPIYNHLRMLTAAQRPSCFGMSANSKIGEKFTAMIQRQIAKLLTYDERNKCSDAQKNMIAQCMSSAFWGVSARKIAKNICSYQLKMLRQSGKNYEERRREGKDFNKLEEDRMNEQI